MLLLVAALVGALIGAFGAPSLGARIATSVGQALAGAIGRSDRDEAIGPSASEQGLFDSAVETGVASDERPSLRDVRLQLIAAHGDEAGRKIYEQLVLDAVAQGHSASSADRPRSRLPDRTTRLRGHPRTFSRSTPSTRCRRS